MLTAANITKGETSWQDSLPSEKHHIAYNLAGGIRVKPNKACGPSYQSAANTELQGTY